VPVYRIGSKTVLFIHIPKTAGMAVHAHLAAHGPTAMHLRIASKTGGAGLRHQDAAGLKKILLPEMIDYAFMVVRHPVARLVSEYRYQGRLSLMHLSRLHMLNFDLWLQAALWRYRRKPLAAAGHFRPQVSYECFDCEVFRYEDGLDRVMQAVSRVTGVDLPAQTPPQNVSATRAVHVSQASLDRIAQVYAADYQRFGYDLTPPALKGVTYRP
jgi:hypothetical protein